MSNDWRDEYISKFKLAKIDDELLSIIDSIYEYGYSDGWDEASGVDSPEPIPWEDLD